MSQMSGEIEGRRRKQEQRDLRERGMKKGVEEKKSAGKRRSRKASERL